LRVLFAGSEAYPLIKTGGLADVAGYLPLALQSLGADMVVALPGYARVLEQLDARVIAHVSTFRGYALIREARLPNSDVRLWLVDHPLFSERSGNPYLDDTGSEWPDNAIRFGLFNQALARVVAGKTSIRMQFDLVHCHDWQTGLLPVYMHQEKLITPSIFTIHNLAYQGLYPAELHTELELPLSSWSHDGVEFHHMLSFIKGGLVYADRITTVSPTYAEEIKRDEFGYGLSGLLLYRSDDLTGIINGIDVETWNPAKDPLIAEQYDADLLELKVDNKLALQRAVGLPEDPDVMVLGNVGRMVEQKGIDIILDALPELVQLPVQIVIEGSGESAFEVRLADAMSAWPDKVGGLIGYNEPLAHLVEAGADAFLMPSRFEPCGLNQMYSQAYGTLPIVYPTGGLRDTVVDATDQSIADGVATGFYMDSLSKSALLRAVSQALRLYHDRDQWQRLQVTAMQQDFSWEHSAREYLRLYQMLSRSAE
jgi:starch synthase